MAIYKTTFAALATLALAACAAPANNPQGGCPCMQQQGGCGGAGKPCPMMQGGMPGPGGAGMPCPMMQQMQQGQPAPMPPVNK